MFLGDRYAGCRPGAKLTVHYTGLVIPPSAVWCEQVSGHSALIVWNKGKQSILILLFCFTFHHHQLVDCMEYLLQMTIDMLQLTVLSQPQSVLFSLMMTRPNLQIFTYHVQFSIFAKFFKIMQELSVLWTKFSFWENCLDFNSIPGKTNLKRGIYIP